VLLLLPGKSPDSAGDLLARGLARMEVTSLLHNLQSLQSLYPEPWISSRLSPEP